MTREEWEKFWESLLGDSEKMKLPMKGAPTLKTRLERKMSDYRRRWR